MRRFKTLPALSLAAVLLISACGEYKANGYRTYSEPTLNAHLERMRDQQYGIARYALPTDADGAVEVRPGVIIYPYEGAQVSNERIYYGGGYSSGAAYIAPVEAAPLPINAPPLESAYPQWGQGY